MINKADSNAFNLKSSISWAAIVACIHLVVALILRFWCGLKFQNNEFNPIWNGLHQVIESELLRDNFFQSIYYLHIQPPLLSLIGAIFIHLNEEFFLTNLNFFYILLGSIAASANFITLISSGFSLIPSLVLSILFALNPIVFAYEGYIIYPLLTYFLISIIVCGSSLSDRIQKLYPFLLISYGLVGLIYLRSSYQILPLFLCYFLISVPESLKKRVKIHFLICFLLALALYIKNYAEFGMMGTSSFAGVNFFNVATADYSQQELSNLSGKGIIPELTVSLRGPKFPSGYKEYGYEAISPIPALSGERLNNLVMLQINKLYIKTSLTLIFLAPKRFLKTISNSYFYFTSPSDSFYFNHKNYESTGILGLIYHHLQTFSIKAINFISPDISSWFFILIPISVFLGLTILFFHYKYKKIISAPNCIKISIFLICYSTFFGCIGDFGENVRYRFDIEQLILITSLVLMLPIFQFLTRIIGSISKNLINDSKKI